MKNGCFIKTIFVVTILTAAIIYLIENKGKEFLFRQGKDLAREFLVGDFDNKFNFVKKSPQKDSLKILIDSISFNLENFSDLSDEESANIISKFDMFLTDSIISMTELKELKDIVKERLAK